MGWKFGAYAHFASLAPVGIFWMLSFLRTRQIFEWFMMLVHVSVPGHWITECIAMVYIFIFTDWTEWTAIMGAFGYMLYNAGFFTFQFLVAPSVKEWYDVAMQAVNIDEYALRDL